MMPLRLNLRELEKNSLVLRGEVSADDLELGGVDELIRIPCPVRHELRAEKVERGVLVTGRVRLALECECCRCLRPFTVDLDFRDWTLHLALDGPDRVAVDNDCVDLTPYVREDILLAFPQHPLCDPECAGLPNSSAGGTNSTNAVGPTAEAASAWAVLNKLKL